MVWIKPVIDLISNFPPMIKDILRAVLGMAPGAKKSTMTWRLCGNIANP
jgi:hypothetical protein